MRLNSTSLSLEAYGFIGSLSLLAGTMHIEKGGLMSSLARPSTIAINTFAYSTDTIQDELTTPFWKGQFL